MPTVSVIVPNYCHAPYLEQRIESILQQTFQDFELILLDDCSTDGSRFFLYRFLCPRNTIYNAGMALVRRSALPADDNYTQYRYCGDWLFWIQIVSGGGNVVYLAEPLNYYRVHDSNTTAESIVTGRKHIETLRILEETFRLIDPPLICRLSIAGKHLLRIRKAAGSHWNEEPYLSVRLAWRERYRHPRMIMFWHKVFKDLPRSFSR